MAFGFLVEKFDLFLEVAAPSLVDSTLSLPGQRFGNFAGLALIVLGTAIVAIAAIRFRITAKNIDSEELHPGPGARIDVALALLLVALGCALFLYYRTRLSPLNNDGRQRSTIGCENFADGASLI
jgi:putative membrane protein